MSPRGTKTLQSVKGRGSSIRQSAKGKRRKARPNAKRITEDLIGGGRDYVRLVKLKVSERANYSLV